MFPNHVYKLYRVLYGLKQAPRVWYEQLRELLEERGFEVGQIDPTLFTKKVHGEILFSNYMLMILSLYLLKNLSMMNL
jgi:hypothetical protein